MKKLIRISIVILGCLYIGGCENEFTQNKPTPKYTDSFINAEQDKVIGNIRFGMSKKETEIAIKKFDENNKRDNGRGYDGKFIGNVEYDMILTDYDSDRLYRVCIECSCMNAYSEEGELTKLIGNKYGNSDKEGEIFYLRPKEDKNPWYNQDVKIWDIGKKTITIKLNVHGSNRNTSLEINEPKIEKMVMKRKEDREKFLKDSLSNSAKNIF